jgi:hypothetical protein
MAKFEPRENEEERRAWIKRQKAKRVRAFKGRYGWATSTFGFPTNPRTVDQQRHRQNILAVSRRWRTLSLDQQGTWRVLAANAFFVNDKGEPVKLNCFNLFYRRAKDPARPRPPLPA